MNSKMKDMNNTEKTNNTFPEEETERNDSPASYAKLDANSILARLEEITNDIENTDRQEIESLKQAFYKLHKSQIEAEKKSFIENGGEEKAFIPTKDEFEPRFKELMNIIKDKRNQIAVEQEQLKEENYQKKLQIIEKIKEFVASEDAGKHYNDFKALRQEWNEIKLIPQEKATELWKTYQLYVEKFYDLLKINSELRTYDFKKNLELKTALCEAAEKLNDEPDVVSAFYQLQNLHQEFREIGPVAPELREEIWTRFKNASTVINKKHQQHFEDIKAKEQENYDAKAAICEKIESIDCNELKTFADWNDKTNEIINLQNEWKTIGFAPQKLNVKIFERFRAACDKFFMQKSEFYKALKAQMSENLQKKTELCEKAEAIKDSTDWKNATDVLTKLQAEWKTIGAVNKKYSDAIWKRFISACDYFFEQKQKATSSQKNAELSNLAEKTEIIKQAESIADDTDPSEAISIIKQLQAKWNQIGFVPFKDKDRIFKQFKAVTDKWYDRLRSTASEKRLSAFKNNISNMAREDNAGALSRERDKIVRAYENLKSELATYENNLGFLNVSSSRNNSFLQEVNKKIEKLKADIKLTEEKLRAIENSIAEHNK